MRTVLRRIVEELGPGIRLTPNQDLLLCHIPGERRAWINRVLVNHEVPRPETVSQVRRLAMACPAKPTGGLAMTDAERLLPLYLSALEEAGLGDVHVVIRMAGCPNSCSSTHGGDRHLWLRQERLCDPGGWMAPR